MSLSVSELKSQLIRLHQLHEACLADTTSSFSDLLKIEADIASLLQKAMADYSWPGISLVGWDAGLAAIRALTRCVSQGSLMRTSLLQVEQAYRMGDIPVDWFAELYDAIQFWSEKPQLFGTHFDWNDQGEWVMSLLKDEADLPRRRELFGLMSVEELLRSALKREKCAPKELDLYRHRQRARKEAGQWAVRAGISRIP